MKAQVEHKRNELRWYNFSQLARKKDENLKELEIVQLIYIIEQ